METDLISKETRHVFWIDIYRVDLVEEWSVPGRFFTLGIQARGDDKAEVVEKVISCGKDGGILMIVREDGSVSFVSTDPLRELYYNVTQKLLKDAGMDEAVADAIGKKVLELFILRRDVLI